jgi:methylated-DNA-[protein]-cysteine S-methyltransferase
MGQYRGKPAPPPAAGCRRDDGPFRAVRSQLAAYFGGELREFDLPLCMPGTPFQCQVWEGLRAIPYGAAVSYAELARTIGRAGASRAVGSANGRNPISEWLLAHEASVIDQNHRRPIARAESA